MSPYPVLPRRGWRLAGLLAAMALFGALCAPAADFGAGLSPAEQAALGLPKLSAAQTTALNALVARDLLSARQGGVTAFAGTFTGRRTPAERRRAGLDQLTPPEQDTLNTLVAEAMAQPPTPAPSVAGLRQENPEAVNVPRRLQIHGMLSYTYGWGGGGSFQAASLYTEVTDPDHNVTVAVGIDTIKGDGYLLRRADGGYDCWHGW
ncbi:MAG: hypothetical protein ACHQ4G_00965 [Opitutales bacterium]